MPFEQPEAQDADFPPARENPGAVGLPEPGAFAKRLVVGVIEIATGRRSAAQLGRHTSPAVQAGLARDAGRITRLGTATRPASVHSVHASTTSAGIAEVAVVVRIEGRFRAIALRLEAQHGRWRCVRLQIG
ncbi:Rv3235 family protein [Jatrophihabitans telluris]|uniref:Rv3235 family protein n=1 Tax=Jatrophihabitans telluris TaxID=2038343 RepID=A0ABY4R191_9ACTN|nr:Rv3235 family protein [Jatrophihabitans telluris]UQX89688.1 Rv3235 family protein [Jatrophihabitans telluris]